MKKVRDAADWHQRMAVLTVMQHLDNRIMFAYGLKVGKFFQKGLLSRSVPGQAVSANIGANPSLTITALAERAMFSIPSADKKS